MFTRISGRSLRGYLMAKWSDSNHPVLNLSSDSFLPIDCVLKARLSLASLQLHLGLFSFTCYLSDLLHTPVEIVFWMFMDAIIICPCFLVLPNGLTSIYEYCMQKAYSGDIESHHLWLIFLHSLNIILHSLFCVCSEQDYYLANALLYNTSKQKDTFTL